MASELVGMNEFLLTFVTHIQMLQLFMLQVVVNTQCPFVLKSLVTVRARHQVFFREVLLFQVQIECAKMLGGVLTTVEGARVWLLLAMRQKMLLKVTLRLCLK